MSNLANKIIENSEISPNKICFVEQDNKYTNEEFYIKIANFKQYLKERGIKKNSKVLILMPMKFELYISLYTLWAIGAVPVFMDTGFIKQNLLKNKFEEIDFVIGNTKYLTMLNINSSLRKKIKVNINKIELYKGKKELDVEELPQEFPAIYTYTSGTTGKPKVTVRTHDFLEIQAEILKKELDGNENDIELSTMPIFTLLNINMNITTVIADVKFSDFRKSNPEKLVNQINKYRN